MHHAVSCLDNLKVISSYLWLTQHIMEYEISWSCFAIRANLQHTIIINVL